MINSLISILQIFLYIRFRGFCSQLNFTNDHDDGGDDDFNEDEDDDDKP